MTKAISHVFSFCLLVILPNLSHWEHWTWVSSTLPTSHTYLEIQGQQQSGWHVSDTTRDFLISPWFGHFYTLKKVRGLWSAKMKRLKLTDCISNACCPSLLIGSELGGSIVNQTIARWTTLSPWVQPLYLTQSVWTEWQWTGCSVISNSPTDFI